VDEQTQDRANAQEAEAAEAWSQAEAPRRLPTRRQFVTGALAFGALAWSGTLDARPLFLDPAGLRKRLNLSPPVPLQKIEEIGAVDGRLRATITIRSGQRTLPGASRAVPLRYLEGKNGSGQVVWPPSSTGAPSPLPGPTLRARVGDQVNITFLNHVDTSQFGNTIDTVEHTQVGCQRVVDGGTGQELYPGNPADSVKPKVATAHDVGPNCFHASSTTNLHFHGTHITPDATGDNVLIQVRPNATVTGDSVKADFDTIFNAAEAPTQWCQLPATWRQTQIDLLRQYDETAPWQGVNGTPGHPALPLDRQLLPPTEETIRHGGWPQDQIGAYPYRFQLTPHPGPDSPVVMGQSPGTHWYHAHKHGSTAINVFNGMAGVFIIEGDYDAALNAALPNLVQQVLLVQNFAESPVLMRAGSNSGPAKTLYVNGQANPTISMRPGEIQLWRLVNASVRAVTTLRGFTPLSAPSGAAGPEMRQTAQDGVQFSRANYTAQPRLTGALTDASRANAFAAGNRIDLLVKAPSVAGTWQFQVDDTAQFGAPATLPVVILEVTSDPPANMQFPTEDQFPEQPAYLADITGRIDVYRPLDFGWEPERQNTLGLNRVYGAPQFMINGEQFESGRFDQTMILGDTEEWTLLNTTKQMAHPFHIHVNPFQVIEIYDPVSGTTYRPESSFVWQDVVAIPPGKFDTTGVTLLEPGHVKIRHKFVDFTGSYVLHCHMLAHEDRGMMQLVRVIPGASQLNHH
jgi:FtsP/CotA-like multicopper oxidase with cupredoxin domain